MRIKNIVFLQSVIVIYTFSGVMSKKAAGSGDNPLRFLFFLGMEFVILGVYALLWQQMLKRFELSVAYANRSMAVVWSMAWAAVFFQEPITIQNLVGVALVVTGILIINTGAEAVKND